MDYNLNVRFKTVKLLGKKYHVIGLGNNFLDMTSKAQVKKSTSGTTSTIKASAYLKK